MSTKFTEAEVVIKEIPPFPHKRHFKLVIDEDVAETLLALTYRTGGDPEDSRRSHLDKFRGQLKQLGLTDRVGQTELIGSLNFKDVK